MTRKLTSKVAPRSGRSNGPKNAPAPKIPHAKINKHGAPPPQQGTKPKPEMYPQQLNPLCKTPGQPQYRDEKIPGTHLRALVAHLRES